MCSSLEGDYLITEEKDITLNKDTSRILLSGADKVFWLRVKTVNLIDGFMDFDNYMKTYIFDKHIIVCESNSLRKVVKPGIFIIIHCSKHFKQSADEVKHFADVTIKSGFSQEDILNNISVKNNICHYNKSVITNHLKKDKA